MITLENGAAEYVYVPVTVTVGSVPADPGAILAGLTQTTAKPAAYDLAAELVDGHVRFLANAADLEPGIWFVWLKFVDEPETIIRERVATIRVKA